MGNSKSTEPLSIGRPIEPTQWQRLYLPQGNEVWLEKRTGKIGEMHRLSFDNHILLDEELQIYEFRRRQKQRMVEVYHVSASEDLYGCSGKQSAKIMIEWIPYRLSGLGNLSTQEGLYVVRQALAGFKSLQEWSGCFKLDDRLICINGLGKIKVWHNDNLILNHAEHHRLLPQARNPQEALVNQIQMVDKVIQMIWRHILPSSNSKFPHAWAQKCHQKPSGGMTFFQAINFIEEYVEQNCITKVDKIRMPTNGSSHLNFEALSLVPEIPSQNQLIIDYEKSKIPCQDCQVDINQEKFNVASTRPSQSSRAISIKTPQPSFRPPLNDFKKGVLSTGGSTRMETPRQPIEPTKIRSLGRANKQGCISMASLNNAMKKMAKVDNEPKGIQITPRRPPNSERPRPFSNFTQEPLRFNTSLMLRNPTPNMNPLENISVRTPLYFPQNHIRHNSTRL